nr:MAG TPA: hypothetical protein [Caudoviricetes sp.]
MTTNRVENKKPKTFTREELVNMIKAQVLNGVLNEVIVLDDGDIREGKGDNLLKEAKNRIFNVLDEVINDVKKIEDTAELLIESTVSTTLMVIAQERGREDNEMEL